MKLLAIIIQNKKGQNIFLVTSNNFSAELAYRYSTIIYDFILKNHSMLLGKACLLIAAPA